MVVRASVQMAAARPAISLGLRAATATVPALVFGELTGRPGLLWMSLGGWLGTLADREHPKRILAVEVGGKHREHRSIIPQAMRE